MFAMAPNPCHMKMVGNKPGRHPTLEHIMKISPKSTFVALTVGGLLAVTLSSCSSQSSTDNSTSSSSAGTGTSSSATPSAAPTPAANVTDAKGMTQVILDKGFLDALGTLKLTPSTFGDAKLGTVDDGTGLTFPITGGAVKYFDPSQRAQLPDGYVQGELDHTGSGLNLKGGDTTVSIRNLVVIPNSNSRVTGDVFVNGKEAAKGVTVFRLDGSTLNPLAQDSNGNAVLKGTTVYVSKDAAGLLNQTFKTDAVTDQLKVGIAKITLTTK